MKIYVKVNRIQTREVIEISATDREFEVELPENSTDEEILLAIDDQLQDAEWNTISSDDNFAGTKYNIISKECLEDDEGMNDEDYYSEFVAALDARDAVNKDS